MISADSSIHKYGFSASRGARARCSEPTLAPSGNIEFSSSSSEDGKGRGLRYVTKRFQKTIRKKIKERRRKRSRFLLQNRGLRQPSIALLGGTGSQGPCFFFPPFRTVASRALRVRLPPLPEGRRGARSLCKSGWIGAH